jgi:hypothetical protein
MARQVRLWLAQPAPDEAFRVRVGVVRLGSAKHVHDAGQRRLGADSHVQRLDRE